MFSILVKIMSNKTLKSVVFVAKRSYKLPQDLVHKKEKKKYLKSEEQKHLFEDERSGQKPRKDWQRISRNSHWEGIDRDKWISSLERHLSSKPLGPLDDWPALSHKHELMPLDGKRYWHQHLCERCGHRFEHKHKQRGNESVDYNKHICNDCGGTKGSRRVKK